MWQSAEGNKKKMLYNNCELVMVVMFLLDIVTSVERKRGVKCYRKKNEALESREYMLRDSHDPAITYLSVCYPPA